MENGVRGKYLPDNDAVIAAVTKSAASAGTDFYERSMQTFVHRLRKCVANGGENVER
jgi:hypothetical protein